LFVVMFCPHYRSLKVRTLVARAQFPVVHKTALENLVKMNHQGLLFVCDGKAMIRSTCWSFQRYHNGLIYWISVCVEQCRKPCLYGSYYNVVFNINLFSKRPIDHVHIQGFSQDFETITGSHFCRTDFFWINYE
jgi:hypothetical protein